MKKSVCIVLAFILCLSAAVIPANADGFETSACAYALYCVNNGEFLLSDNADERLPMASTTKIMTALIALEEAERGDRVITFTEEMIAEGSSMYLEVGEKLTLTDLAVGMLMQSGNDAANAAAVAISGSVEDFAERMNERAREIGMTDTRFVTPSGLDSDGHCSTARDMALLMAEAMRNSGFRRITSQTSMSVSFAEPSDKTVSYPNHNKLLNLYDGCIGGKTGYTDLAGRCLVSAAERDDLMLIAVTLNDGDDWNDHMRMYDFGFEHYCLYNPDADEFIVDAVGGDTDTLTAYIKDTGSVVVESDYSDSVEETVYLPPFIYLPVDNTIAVGMAVYRAGGKTVAELPIYIK